MSKQEESLKKVISHCKEYGFVFQSSEIYDGLSAVYDYGHNGTELKKNIREYWWKAMVQMHENIVGIDSAIFMHPKVWKASGHVDGFNDPMIDNKDSKKRYRADQLLEDKIEKRFQDLCITYFNKNIDSEYKQKLTNLLEFIVSGIIDREIGKPNLVLENLYSSGPSTDPLNSFESEVRNSLTSLGNQINNSTEADDVLTDIYLKLANSNNPAPLLKYTWLRVGFELAMNFNNLEWLKSLIVTEEIACPVSGTRNWTEVRQFNLMYSTQMGSLAEEADEVYLRPETAQGIFVNFLNVQKTGRLKVPFGIAQTGKAFRNEIIARQFIMRMKEFEQMEMQFFVRPGTEMEYFDYWKNYRMTWHKSLGIPDDKYRFHEHTKLAHYANAAVDIEYDFPFGFKEVEGIHSRTDFDLKQHQEFSGKKLQYFDPEINQNYVPYVVETSLGLDRMFLLLMFHCLQEETVVNGDKTDTRTVLRLPSVLAPVKLAVFPLVKKDGLPEKAREIIDMLKFDYTCSYEEKDAIGKRYRRQDAIGTPFCVTVDYESMDDNTVTLRYRDSMEQKRVAIADLPGILADEISWKKVLNFQS